MNRRQLLQGSLLAAGGIILPPKFARADTGGDYNDPAWIWTAGSNEASTSWTLGSDDAGLTYAYNNFTDGNVTQNYGAAGCLNFTGTGIQLIALAGPNNGVAVWYLDDGGPNLIDTNSGGGSSMFVAVDIDGLSYGPHVLEYGCTPYTNTGGYDQGIYGFTVRGGQQTPLWGGSVAGYGDFALNGNWSAGADYDGSDLGSGHCWTNDPNDSSASLTAYVQGSLIEIYGRPDVENGSFNVTVDGTFYGSWDERFGSQDNDALNSKRLATMVSYDGFHAVTVRPNGDGGIIQIDVIAAFSAGGGGSKSAAKSSASHPHTILKPGPKFRVVPGK